MIKRRNNRQFILLLILASLFAFSSCKKEKSFPFEIINNSNYDITRLSFEGAINGDELALSVNQTSDIIFLSYQRRIRVTPKLICLSIEEFENPTGNFNVIQTRPCLPFSKKDLSEETNTVTITSVENADTLSFEIELN